MEQEYPQLGELPSIPIEKNQAEEITEIQDEARFDAFRTQFVSCMLSWLTGYYFSVRGFSALLANIDLSTFATRAFNRVALPQDAQKALDEQQIATHPLFKSILQKMIEPFLQRATERLNGDEVYAAISFFALTSICIKLSETSNLPADLARLRNRIRQMFSFLHPDLRKLYQLARDELLKAPEPPPAALNITQSSISELIELSHAAKRCQQWEEALRIEREILRRKPNNVNACVNIAWLLGTKLGKEREALEILGKADIVAQRLGIGGGEVYRRLLELQARIKTSIEQSTIPADQVANSGEQGCTNIAPPSAENAPADAAAEERIEAVDAAGPALPSPAPAEDQSAATANENPPQPSAAVSLETDASHTDPPARRSRRTAAVRSRPPLQQPPASPPEPLSEKPSNIDVFQFDRFVETLLREAKNWPLDARGEPWHLVPKADQEILQSAITTFETRLHLIIKRANYGAFWKTFNNIYGQLRRNEINIKTLETMMKRLPNGIDWSKR